MERNFFLGSIIIFLGLVTFSWITANHNYRPFNLSKKDITTLLSHTVAVPADAGTARTDISFLCADLKYNGDTLKFCELGDAVYMFFTRDMDLEINSRVVQMHAPGWGVFWHYLAKFKLPIWFVGKVRDYNACAMDVFERLGGRYVPDLQSLQNDSDFKRLIKKNFVKTERIRDHSSIVVYCAENVGMRDSKDFLGFRQRYPDFIFVNSMARNIVPHKDRTYQLFQDVGLIHCIPKTKIIPKNYKHGLSGQNVSDIFSSSYLVIKPLAGSCSRGVVVTERERLDATLASLFHAKIITQNTRQQPWAHEWKNDVSAAFMISEYIPSKILIKAGKHYDPTMRVVFMLHHDAKKIFVTVMGAFWKIPFKSLDDEASLTEKHVTRAHLVVDDPDLFYSGILVEKNDMMRVRNILNDCLPILYQAMLKKYHIQY